MAQKKKWYSFFVVNDEEAPRPADAGADSASPPRRVSEVVADVDAAPAFDEPSGPPADLTHVYESAKIAVPPHGYTILKVADMLESEHIRALPPDVKRKSVLVALEAAGVTVEEIVEDAVRRDRALDTYERVLEKHLEDARAQAAAENQQIEAEIARVTADLRGRIDANRQRIEREEREVQAWRASKRQAENAIAQAVSYFVSENPITLGARSSDVGTGSQ